ncbi:MAG TPA: cation:proton antiporter [Xanthobacteraceae bacterium]|nr:cation:proton antiporter [Xanthobacteraceae bacterium]
MSITNLVGLRARGRTASYACGAVIVASGVFGAGRALAADGGAGPSEALFLAQIVVLMLSGRLLGEAMLRIGQPAVMGQLLAGVILGPSLLGLLWPDLQHALFPSTPVQKSMLDAISQFGILLLLLLTGMETDLKLVRKVGAAAISVSLTGVAVPFACGVALGEFLPDSLLPRPDQRLLTSLFLGTALSISSIKIVAAIVRDMKFTRRNLGQVIVASAILEDTIGWIIIAVTFGLAQAGKIDVLSVAKSVLGAAAFLAVSLTVGRRVVFWLIRWANDNLESEFAVITMILGVMGLMALTTHAIGVHTVLGAFVSGILIGESPILTRHIDQQLRGLIMAFFMPVFFGAAGLSADLTVLTSTTLLLMTLGLIAIASIGKFAGAFIGGEIGGLSKAESLAIACGMNARGSTEVIVASIGLAMGALSQNLFTMIVAMAITTTMAMPPMLRWALARVPLGKDEKERLEREEIEARGFVPNLERLLLAIDHSPNGKFSSRLAGLLAGQRGIPITVLPLAADARKGSKKESTKEAKSKAKSETKSDARIPAEKGGPRNGEQEAPTGAEAAKETVKAAAEDTRKAQPKEDEPAPVDVTVRIFDVAATQAVAEEAEKGYDLLFVGVENPRTKNGAFHKEIDRIAAAFQGPLAIVAAQGIHLKEPEQSPLNILVPVNGTEVSRRAAELAIAMARAFEAPITALYVSAAKRDARGRRGGGTRERAQEQAILKEIVVLADQYDQEVATRVRADQSPDEAVLTEAKRDGHNLIIMGVGRRPGDSLFFGETAAGIFEKSPISVVLVSS